MTTTERRHPHVANLDEVEAVNESKGTKFGYKEHILGPAVGSAQLGCTHYEIAPGRAAFPFHWHSAMEEAAFVLEGAGTLRIGDKRVPVRAGDFLAFPTGPETAHQLVNTSDKPLKYLCFSTKSVAEVVGYPDSKKLGVRAGTTFDKPWARKLLPADMQSAGYYDGEDIG